MFKISLLSLVNDSYIINYISVGSLIPWTPLQPLVVPRDLWPQFKSHKVLMLRNILFPCVLSNVFHVSFAGPEKCQFHLGPSAMMDKDVFIAHWVLVTLGRRACWKSLDETGLLFCWTLTVSEGKMILECSKVTSLFLMHTHKISKMEVLCTTRFVTVG